MKKKKIYGISAEKKKTHPAEKRRSIGSKLYATFTTLLFAAGFAVGGSAFIGGLAQHAYGWYTARSWQPVMAEVTQAQLHTSRGRRGSIFHRVTAEYRYKVNGKEYSGKRVGFGDELSDNVGSWHQERFAELENARSSGQQVLAWFDPKNPADSVVDREMLWGTMLFLLLFAMAFSGMSLGMLWWRLPDIWRVK